MSICPPTGTGVKVHGDDLFNTPLDQAQIDFENEGGETYICGNPPYLGAKKKSSEQSEDMIAVGLRDAQLLDYVCAFIIKGLAVIEKTQCGMALVSTSSICQGEQVSLLWPRVLRRATIGFAYRPFKWANSAANNAGVWCTIVGIEATARKEKLLFFDDQVKQCANIAPYLIPGENVICEPRNTPVSALATMKMGSNPVDGKRLILEPEDVTSILTLAPQASQYLKMYGGTNELVSGLSRWCLWVNDADVEKAKSIPVINSMIERCREYRLGAGRDARKAAKRPHAFCYSTYEERSFIYVGNTIGNALPFVPADIKRAGYVSSHAAFTIYGHTGVEFSIIVSTVHRIWAETIAGRLGNGTRYGNTIVYNTFPVPKLTDQNKADLIRCSEEILLARESYFPATIAEMYDPERLDAEFPRVREAHEANDEVLERIYIGRRFKNDTERLEKLFELYTKMTQNSGKPQKPSKQNRIEVA